MSSETIVEEFVDEDDSTTERNIIIKIEHTGDSVNIQPTLTGGIPIEEFSDDAGPEYDESTQSPGILWRSITNGFGLNVTSDDAHTEL